jgi:hypothetical protein
MNRLDFNILAGWPGSTETWKFLQDMILQLQQVSLLGGANYILSGCGVVGPIVADGVVVINGEILPFKGGALQANVVVTDTVTTREFFGGARNPYYHNRQATFGSGAGAIDFASMLRLPVEGLVKKYYDLANALTALTTAFNNHNHSYFNLLDRPAGYISYVGNFGVGDVGQNGRIDDNDSGLIITIPDQQTANYIVAGSLVDLSQDANNDNDVMWSITSKTATSFGLMLREVSVVVQNLRFEFAIIKT